MPISRIGTDGIEAGAVAPSDLSTGAPSWSGSGYLTSQINNATAGQYAPMYFFRLDSGLAGANVNTAQNVFGVGVTLSASTVYAFEAVYAGAKTAGTTSHTIGFGFGGTATLNNISYFALGNNNIGGFPTLQSSTAQQAYVNTAANTTFIGATSSASVCYFARISGTVSVNVGGTFIPQYTLSAAPGGAYTTAAGSYFLIYPIGASGANTNIGGWA